MARSAPIAFGKEFSVVTVQNSDHPIACGLAAMGVPATIHTAPAAASLLLAAALSENEKTKAAEAFIEVMSKG